MNRPLLLITVLMFAVVPMWADASILSSFSGDVLGHQDEDVLEISTSAGSGIGSSLLVDLSTHFGQNPIDVDALHILSPNALVVSFNRNVLGHQDEDLIMVTHNGTAVTGASLFLDVTPLTTTGLDALHVLSDDEFAVSFASATLGFQDEDIVKITRSATGTLSASLFMDITPLTDDDPDDDDDDDPDDEPDDDPDDDPDDEDADNDDDDDAYDINALHVLSDDEILASFERNPLGFQNEDVVKITRSSTGTLSASLYLDMTPLTTNRLDAVSATYVANPEASSIAVWSLLAVVAIAARARRKF